MIPPGQGHCPETERPQALRLCALSELIVARRIEHDALFAQRNARGGELLEPRRERLKILGRARVLDAREHRDIADRLTPSPDLRGKVERLFLIDVVSFDWNCPQFITPRYTEEEVRAAVAPLKQRIAELEAKLAGNSCPH